MEQYQGKRYGKKLLIFIKSNIKSMNCRKMFLITNKSNVKACRCYEKSGGICNNNDDVVYEFKEH